MSKQNPNFTLDQGQWIEDKFYNRISALGVALSKAKEKLQIAEDEIRRLEKDFRVAIEEAKGNGG